MKEPAAYGGWNGVLNTGIYLVTILYFFVGFFGYIRYGSNARGSISLNLPNDNKYITICVYHSYFIYLFK
jgi:proton-coupled amino acid transporter